jgi:hypothetical protein
VCERLRHRPATPELPYGYLRLQVGDRQMT